MTLSQVLTGIRPKTLVAAFAPPLCAFSYHAYRNNQLRIGYLLLTIGLAICIQVATNFYNDAIDCLKGADDKRVGPKRISGETQVNIKHVFYLGHLFLILAVLCAIPVVIKGGVFIALLGVISLFLAYGYTGGPYPIAYLGLGELFVFLFFGLVATLGSYFIFSNTIDLPIVLVACQLGLLSSVLIGINNFRDRQTDLLVNKRTMATRLDKDTYLLLLNIFLFTPYVIVICFTFFLNYYFIFNLLSVFIAIKITIKLKSSPDSFELNQLLALSGKHLLFFSILFSGICLCI